MMIIIPGVMKGASRLQKYLTERSCAAEKKQELVQSIYTAELGVRERTGNNDGAQVEDYLRYVELRKGNPWCAAFVCWVFGKAGIANPRSGWSPNLFPAKNIIWQRSQSAALRTGTAERRTCVPARGDVFGIWFPDKRRIAHVGFVDQWDDSWVVTVEGNTNEAGSREGDGVYRKRRLVRSLWQVASWIKGQGSTSENEKGGLTWKRT